MLLIFLSSERVFLVHGIVRVGQILLVRHIAGARLAVTDGRLRAMRRRCRFDMLDPEFVPVWAMAAGAASRPPASAIAMISSSCYSIQSFSSPRFPRLAADRDEHRRNSR